MESEVSGANSIVCNLHTKQIDDHEQRLRVLERAMWKIAGAASLAAFLGAYITKHLP
jgi:hypothetical protein